MGSRSQRQNHIAKRHTGPLGRAESQRIKLKKGKDGGSMTSDWYWNTANKTASSPLFKPERTGSWAELACKEWRDYYVRYVEAQTSLNIYCDSDFLCLISKGCPACFLSACYGWSFSASLSSRASVSIFLYMCPFVPVALFILSFLFYFIISFSCLT